MSIIICISRSLSIIRADIIWWYPILAWPPFPPQTAHSLFVRILPHDGSSAWGEVLEKLALAAKNKSDVSDQLFLYLGCYKKKEEESYQQYDSCLSLCEKELVMQPYHGAKHNKQLSIYEFFLPTFRTLTFGQDKCYTTILNSERLPLLCTIQPSDASTHRLICRSCLKVTMHT